MLFQMAIGLIRYSYGSTLNSLAQIWNTLYIMWNEMKENLKW